jgi:hypothetical protein
MKIYKKALFLIIISIWVLSASCIGEEVSSPQGQGNAPGQESIPGVDEDLSGAPGSAETPVQAPPSEPGTWLVMLYQDADDEILEEDIFTDLNEAELVGSSEKVTIVSQMDRYNGGFSGDGDWTTVKRFLIKKDEDLEHIKSTEIADLGELDSGDPQTLIDFATWAIQTYPAEKSVLILSDHGAGWLGGWNDNDPNPESSFTTNKIDNALRKIVTATGIGQFELVGFDACLMSQVESVTALVPYAKYAVASEEVEPALGWAYAASLSQLVANPQMSGSDLANAIVSTYVTEDIRITDDNSRRKLVRETFESQGNLSAEDVAKGMSVDTTLTAIDLSAMSDLHVALNNLAVALTETNPKPIARARSYTQSYESVFGPMDPPSYIDLGHFTNLLGDKIKDEKVINAIEKVQAAISKAVLSEKHGGQRPGSTGFSIFFPASKTYSWTAQPGGDPNYSDYASRFAIASLWDDFLWSYYTGQSFDPASADLSVLQPIKMAAAVPTAAPTAITKEAAAITAPGAGEFSIAPLEISTKKLRANETLKITTQITGGNIAYIYMYTLFFNEVDNSYLVADVDYIDAGQTKEIDGVFFPDWGEENVIPLEVEWMPTIYMISDGDEKNDQFALFEPQTYGAQLADAVYSLTGKYIPQNGGNPRSAIMEFDGEGVMKRLLTFLKEDGSGAPREALPEPGDQFTITETWLEFAQNPEGDLVEHPGGTMTFGERPLQWIPYEAFPGKYAIGIVVEDFDGKTVDEWVEEIEVTP